MTCGSSVRPHSKVDLFVLFRILADNYRCANTIELIFNTEIGDVGLDLRGPFAR